MSEATIALTVMTGLIGISFLGFLIWGLCSKQFRNIEAAKYQIFDEDANDSQGNNNHESNGSTGGGDLK